MLRVVTPPASFPVSLAEAKAQLRATDDSNDVLIQALIPAATKFCQSLVQKVFVAQTMEWVLPGWARGARPADRAGDGRPGHVDQICRLGNAGHS